MPPPPTRHHAAIPLASIVSLQWLLADESDGNRQAAGGSLTPADVLTGTRFFHEIPAGAVDRDDHEFVAEYTVALTDGTVKTWSLSIIAAKRWRA